ncbi:P-type cation-transporting ATPase 2 [Phlyctema vagabunda]|uniref:P-type cation-transporting ATPase 2 n=1 Tax=Phlyctema vagabunda TaxID=108571 RepID=A0ABR4PJI7_9HELO
MQDACSKVDRCSAMTLPSEKEISMVGSPLEIDLERGATGLDHVILNVHGMTCVGCETKLSRSLLAVPALKNVQTSLVLGRAEFDFDNNVNSVENIMRIIEKATGFSCEKLTTTGQELDVILRGNIAEFINQTLPLGVYDMVPLDKHTVRIVFNPSIIGARELFERSFDASIQLAPLRPHASLEAGKSHVRNTGLMTVFSAACTIPVLVLAWAPLPERHIQYGGASLALATIVQFVVAGPFYPSALRSLIFTRVIEMDLLIVLSTTAAYVFSVVAFAYEVHGRPLSTGQFFETSTLLVTLIMLGRYISAFARQKAVESISIRSLQPSTALLLNDDGSEQEVDVRLLQHGDNFRVSPESRVTTDGVVLTGISEIDESMVTGEAKLVEKQIGSSVIAGSVNGSGPLVVKLTRLPSDNTISTIATMVDDAKFSKPKTQEIADRVAGYFVPVVVVFCMITFGIWVAVGIEVRKQSGSSAAVNAITYAIAVLIVSCPCAIGLAVPMVIVIAGGVAAKNGVIFRTAETIEIARNVTHVVFDKTGTLTQGHLSVRAEEYATDAKEITQSIVLGIASNIKHPVAAAVTKHLTSNIKAAVVEDVKSVPGCGIEGIWNGAHVRAGNSRWLNLEELPTVKKLLTQGLTVFCVVRETETVAIFGLQDSIRPDAYQVVSELKRRGIDVSIVSGDDTEAVHSVGAELGFPISNVKSRCSPKSKQDYIKDAMVDKDTVIMFCGDGTNDAVALAQAHIGVHMNEGTDVAQSAADAILMRPSLFGIITLIDLSRAAFNRIVFNFTWAFVYNLFAILLAGGAFVNARISPEYAGLGEIVSVLPVILIALQLRWAKF